MTINNMIDGCHVCALTAVMTSEQYFIYQQVQQHQATSKQRGCLTYRKFRGL